MKTATASRRDWLASGLCLSALVFAPRLRAQDVAQLGAVEVARPGRVLMLRHANAPGVGDPPGFRLRDCATQRNLDEAGRAQARRLGEQLVAGGVRGARVYSSPWCRCLDTARLLGLGEVRELEALSSFFARSAEREPRLAALRDFLAQQPIDGPPLVLVTHQVTVTEFTGRGIASGSGAVFALNRTPAPRWLGELAAD